MTYKCEEITRTVRHYFPVLRFSKGPGGQEEPYYPVDPDGWITHQALQDGAPNPHARGTALYRWRAASSIEPADRWIAQRPVIPPGGITLDADPTTGIGHARLSHRPPENPEFPERGDSKGNWYLDFSGWLDQASRFSGLLAHSWKAYSHQHYAALGLPVSDRPTERELDDLDADPPLRFSPQGRSLHSYAEFEPLTRFVGDLLKREDLPAELDWLQVSAGKLQGRSAQLEDYIGLTYYLFYPAYYPPNKKVIEGQWEAITVFLRELGHNNLQFTHTSFSQGWAGGLWPRPLAACKARADLNAGSASTSTSDRPVACVAFGSHANYFTPLDSEIVIDPGINWAAVGFGTAAGVVATIGAALIVAGLLATPISWPLIIAGGIVLIVALILALIAWLFAKDSDEVTSPPYDEGPRNDTHSGDGPIGGGDNGSHTPDAPPPPVDPANPPAETPFLIHPVSEEYSDGTDICTPPPWWTYVGRWGVCVDDRSAMQIADSQAPSWSNGLWRRWPNGYSLTHRNVEAFLDYLTGNVSEDTKTTHVGWVRP